VEIKTKWSLDEFEKNCRRYHNSHNDEYHTASQIWRSLFVNMEGVVFGRFTPTERCFGANFFCELEPLQESDVARSDEHGNEKCDNAKHHYSQNIIIHKLLRIIVDKY
jgi:hypothetical protein